MLERVLSRQCKEKWISKFKFQYIKKFSDIPKANFFYIVLRFNFLNDESNHMHNKNIIRIKFNKNEEDAIKNKNKKGA